jgi:hypothetical protein
MPELSLTAYARRHLSNRLRIAFSPAHGSKKSDVIAVVFVCPTAGRFGLSQYPKQGSIFYAGEFLKFEQYFPQTQNARHDAGRFRGNGYFAQ